MPYWARLVTRSLRCARGHHHNACEQILILEFAHKNLSQRNARHTVNDLARLLVLLQLLAQLVEVGVEGQVRLRVFGCVRMGPIRDARAVSVLPGRKQLYTSSRNYRFRK